MGNAATMAGTAFSNSMVGIVHAIGHARRRRARSARDGYVLPHCMRFNLKRDMIYGELLLPLAGAEA